MDVEGDLGRPPLEVPKHVESGRLGPRDLDLLEENRGMDDGLVRRLVELALRSTVRGRAYVPARMLFVGSAGEVIEELRHRWDPAMADQVAAHVRVAYPSEIDDLEDLRARSAAASEVPPFRLRLGCVGHVGVPTSGSSSKYTRWTEAGLTCGI